ncbi:N-acetylglucosamine kinase-like BadF-type ATPase [Novosphingobium sp. PhB165]|uniref:N-acetylglucosamine kinase n=1 Tax=Novosphingobium sp. PhB165 TaxID=2485105 RepID=UPI001049C4AB|nr:BadF/BadG/BcrA/BcrD ATPase family protein [Novosphingobium sp. PhB165]TCM16519.1 N-acetylglucosamine kinase-like BadF-type ATPase [Novosphingobium sp. PhB165]
MSQSLFLGVDGGGTKTEFVCIDAAGQVLATALTGTTYHLQVGFDEVVRRLESGLSQVCTAIGTPREAIGHAFFGLPAYGEDRAIDPRLHAACGEVLGHSRYVVGNDMICGWAGSFGGEDGINIVAGTGSIGYGERRGRTARVGGWGEVFSDEGSAYWIAIQGLSLFTRMSDGRTPRGPLHERIVAALSLEDDLDLCGRIMGPEGMGRSEIAGLAGLVSEAAAAGDHAARAILDKAACELADMATALRTELRFPEGEAVPLSWSGGVLSREARVRDEFLRIVHERGFSASEPRFAPGYGAALYARKLAERK